MRLRSLHMQNFRQHADTRIEFESGLTGIIGPNGAGKSTILEAIAWALYGKARGTRDSIRFTRAKDRSPVRVELQFDIAGHRYRVVRGLTTAELFQDDGESPIANSITGVTELLQRRLGMTRSEFFHTYFTGQKELDAMSALGPTDRARFLSRVLGYDRITLAQELVRGNRRSLLAEANGVRQGLPDRAAVWRMVEEAEARLAVARTREKEAAAVDARNRALLEKLTPRYTDAQTMREQMQKLENELQIARNDMQGVSRETERLQSELAGIAEAHRELTVLRELMVPLPAVREALAQMDSLAAADARRQALLERVRLLAEEDARSEERLQKLSTAPELEATTRAQLQKVQDELAAVERQLDNDRTAWARDRQEAETRLEALLVQHSELARQKQALEGLGAESPCPTCGRPLGESWRTVLDALTTQIETVTADGNYYRARSVQLSHLPKQMEELEARKEAGKKESLSLERRLTKIGNAMQELAQLESQRGTTSERLREAQHELGQLPSGYDTIRHTELRKEAEQYAAYENQAARVSGLIEREVAVRAELQRTSTAVGVLRERVLELERRSTAAVNTEDDYQQLRKEYERVSAEARRAELESQSAAHDVARVRGELESAESSRREYMRLNERLEQLESEKLLHDELDRAFTDLRTDLNAALRPELSDSGSRFLEALTDGRYSSIELDDEYRMLIMEDGIPKPVISGGEEDLCNLVLRLAISQMIAERAGQNFSLLILDEVFGSLDDARRGNVVDLLRRLHHQFEQVVVITHIEQVREGLDQVLQVAHDPQSGASVVTRGRASMALAGSSTPYDDSDLPGRDWGAL